jgi:hypothetical protein
MSIYDKASLVLIPSGTKTSKVYSQKPVNGDGDFTFSRSTAATRVNADGNIEKETQNLLLQSNNFGNGGYWNDVAVSVTSNQAGYDGTNDAFLITKQSSSYARLQQNLSLSGVVTMSAYLKAGTESLSTFRLGISDYSVQFRLDTLVITDTGNISAIDTGIEDVGSGWYRCYATWNVASTSVVQYYVGWSDSDSNTLYIQDAQVEQGLVARDYIETTTAAVEGGITDNVPRLDYTDSSCPALLLEPQRFNAIDSSEYAGAWSAIDSNITKTDNAATSPEGVDNAVKLEGLTGSGGNQIVNFGTFILNGVNVVGKTYTASVYIKPVNPSDVGDDITLSIQRNTGDFEALTIVNEITSADWKRYDLTYTFTGAGAGDQLGAVFKILRGDTTIDDIYIWGAQLEEGTYATSYIPTYGTSVTRAYENQDVTGLFANVFNNDNLTLFYDFDYNAEGREGSTTAYRIFSGSSQLGIKGRSGSSRSVEIYSSGDFSGSIVFNNIENASRIKVALRVTNGTCELFFNGAKDTETIDVSAAAPYTWGQITMLASSSINTSLNQCLGFPTALTDQELIDLTTI